MRLAPLALLLLVATARAQPSDTGPSWLADHPPVVNRLNLRIGGASADQTGHPTLCMDVKIALGFDLEACGTGEQLLHNDPGQEISHYRINYAFANRALWKGTVYARGGVGIAELQVGKDDPGFVFGGTNVDRGSTSGYEGALSAQWVVPLYKGFDFVVNTTAGLGYFAHAPDLATTKSVVQGFASFEAGIGW